VIFGPNTATPIQTRAAKYFLDKSLILKKKNSQIAIQRTFKLNFYGHSRIQRDVASNKRVLSLFELDKIDCYVARVSVVGGILNETRNTCQW
jgi:hypothetical protein